MSPWLLLAGGPGLGKDRRASETEGMDCGWEQVQVDPKLGTFGTGRAGVEGSSHPAGWESANRLSVSSSVEGQTGLSGQGRAGSGKVLQWHECGHGRAIRPLRHGESLLSLVLTLPEYNSGSAQCPLLWGGGPAWRGSPAQSPWKQPLIWGCPHPGAPALPLNPVPSPGPSPTPGVLGQGVLASNRVLRLGDGRWGLLAEKLDSSPPPLALTAQASCTLCPRPHPSPSTLPQRHPPNLEGWPHSWGQCLPPPFGLSMSLLSDLQKPGQGRQPLGMGGP